MLQQEAPEDFVIATGETRKLQDFIAVAFEAVGLDWKRAYHYRSNIVSPNGDYDRTRRRFQGRPKAELETQV